MSDYPAFVVALVKDGTLALSDGQRKTINAYFAKHEGQHVRMTLSQPTKGRSLNQNAYMWGVVYTMIAAETGHTTEEVHEFMKGMFLPRSFITIGKKTEQLIKSTTTLSTLDMEEYLEHVRAFAATELNMTIPLPHESL
jgi:hypothetical protein